MKQIISVILVVILAVSVFPLTVFASDDTIDINIDVTYKQTEARTILPMINDLRKPQNAWYWNETNSAKLTFSDLSPLVYDYELEKLAMQRAAEIAIYFSHTRPDNTSCFTIHESFNACGENIAIGQSSAEAVFRSWAEEDDPYSGQGHRRNMLSSKFTAVGIGHAVVNGIHCWVQEFKTPAEAETPVTACDSAIPVNVRLSKTLPFNLSYSSTDTIDVSKTAELPKPVISFSNVLGRSTFSLNNADFTISDPSVATIKNNKIYGLSTGQTTLTATVADKKISYTINVTQASNPDDLSSSIMGDVNSDGKVTAADARLALRVSARLESISKECESLADVNGDNKVTASDARFILRVAASLEKF